MFELVTFRLHTLRQQLDGGPQVVDVEFAPYIALVGDFFRDSKFWWRLADTFCSKTPHTEKSSELEGQRSSVI